jgi:5-methylcytosine-specific restriction endonuclease McrA
MKARNKKEAAIVVITNAALVNKIVGVNFSDKCKLLAQKYCFECPIVLASNHATGMVTADVIVFATMIAKEIQKDFPSWCRRALDHLEDKVAKPSTKRKIRFFEKSTNPNAAPSQKKIDNFYGSWEWKRLRYDFIKKNIRKCKCCGATPDDGISINVDHIKPIRHYWHLRTKEYNLQVLCADCNMGKGSRDETDWRGDRIVSLDLIREQLKPRG